MDAGRTVSLHLHGFLALSPQLQQQQQQHGQWDGCVWLVVVFWLLRLCIDLIINKRDRQEIRENLLILQTWSVRVAKSLSPSDTVNSLHRWLIDRHVDRLMNVRWPFKLRSHRTCRAPTLRLMPISWQLLSPSLQPRSLQEAQLSLRGCATSMSLEILLSLTVIRHYIKYHFSI